MSRSAVSELNERLWAEYETVAKWDLSEHKLRYLLLDGIAERLWPGQAREAVWCACGIDLGTPPFPRPCLSQPASSPNAVARAPKVDGLDDARGINLSAKVEAKRRRRGLLAK